MNTVIVDIDNVLNHFSTHYHNYVEQLLGIKATKLIHSDRFYDFVDDYIDDGNFLDVTPNTQTIKVINYLSELGHFIQLITARPTYSQSILDTTNWLCRHKVSYDNIHFTINKFQWLQTQDCFKNNTISFALEDIPKHINDYCSANINTFVPIMDHNKNLNDSHLCYYNSTLNHNDLLTKLTTITHQ